MATLRSVILLAVISNQYHTYATPQKSSFEDVLRFYGEKDSLSTYNVKDFLHLITTRRSQSVDNEDNPLKNSEVFFLYSVSISSGF